MQNASSDIAKPQPLYFEQSKNETITTVADKSWWDKERYRIGGLMRVLSRSAVVASGLGIGTHKSAWRAASGVAGMGAGAFLAAFGEKQGGVEKPIISQEKVGRMYHGIVAASGAALVISGFLNKSAAKNWWTETLAGLWTLGWSAYAALAPEGEKDALVFDNGTTKATPQGFADKQGERNLLAEYKKHPKKLASDMLQFSALFALVDGLKREGSPDIARIISAITLGASNYLQREMKDTDFAPHSTQPTAGR